MKSERESKRERELECYLDWDCGNVVGEVERDKVSLKRYVE